MFRRHRARPTALMIACLLCTSTAAGQQPDPEGPSVLGRQIGEFHLHDIAGRPRSLSDEAGADAIVVVFLGQECPLVRLYAPRLATLYQDYASRGVAWLAINSNRQDSLTELRQFVRATNLPFPLLKDPGNVVADQFGATRTPEVFILDRERVVRYHGRIDDQYTYGLQRPQVEHDHLADALEDLLAGRSVAVPQTETVGCIIGRVVAPHDDCEVTYANQISRILQDNCLSCHRPGEIGPFALGDYDEVAGWAEMIREVVNQRRMPPWSADPQYGHFKNDARLTADEIDWINRWVDAGAPRGDMSQLPPPRVFAEGWQIGEPDLVVPMSKRPYAVPARGTVEYQYFEVDPGFTEDKWIRAAECRPGNRPVIHHIIVGVRDEGEFGRGVHDRVQSDWIAATAPGAPPMVLPAGYAKLVPAGSKLIFQMHYTPNGTPQQDISSIGLVFADPEEVTHRVLTLKAYNTDFRIPAGADDYPVRASYRFQVDAELLSLFPHMHLRGKAFRYTARFPDGREEILLDVPRYDFNWQNAYELVQPRPMPRGTQLRCLARYDNSEDNFANPAPEKSVRWGDQTWEEMMIGYFNVAIPRQAR